MVYTFGDSIQVVIPKIRDRVEDVPNSREEVDSPRRIDIGFVEFGHNFNESLFIFVAEITKIVEINAIGKRLVDEISLISIIFKVIELIFNQAMSGFDVAVIGFSTDGNLNGF